MISQTSTHIATTADDEIVEPVGRRMPEHWWGYILLLPAILLVAGLILYPTVYSFWLSLHSKHAYMPIQTFVGLDNFTFFLKDYEGF